MNILVKIESLEFVRQIIECVVGKFLYCLRCQSGFKGKLLDLEIEVHECSDWETTGCLAHTRIGKQKMYYFINQKENSKRFISFIIAHEFAHLMMCNTSDFFCISGAAKDGSNNFSAIERIALDTGKKYGTIFEELVADYLARYIVEQLDYEDNNGSYKDFLETREINFKVISEFEKFFGKPLPECNYIDDYVETEKNNYEFNYFWHSILAYSFNNIIDVYDKIMGKNAFKNLNELIDETFGNGGVPRNNGDEIFDEIQKFLKGNS